MKIAFINSSYEPGKDGPGDYTRLLAQELERRGWRCGLFSFADRQSQHYLEESQSGISTFRFSKNQSWEKRFEGLRKSIQKFEPDVLSLGIVSYALHPKGIVRGFAKEFAGLNGQGLPWHLMYQEIWIGAHREATMKDRIVGWIQKRYLVEFSRILKPQWTDCWNPVHQECLRKAGVHAAILPIMSTIAVHPELKENEGWDEVIEDNDELKSSKRDRYWAIGFFGTLHPIWPSEPLFSKLRNLAQVKNKKLVFVALGDLRSGKALWEKLKNHYQTDCVFINKGESSSEKISRMIQSFDFGIATTPWQILGKSSTAAAFFEHGVPVIVNREESYGYSDKIESFNHPLAIRMDERFEEKILAAKKGPAKAVLPEVADLFVSRLRPLPLENKSWI